MMQKFTDHRLLSISAERRRPFSTVVEVQRSWQCDVRYYYALLNQLWVTGCEMTKHRPNEPKYPHPSLTYHAATMQKT